MKFRVHYATRYNVSASLNDVVYFLSYHFEESGSSAVDGVLNYHAEHYHMQCDSVTSENFVSYNTATSSMKDWVQSSHGENWGAFTSSIQTTLNSALSSRTSDNPTESITWNSGSQTLDSVAMSTGSNMEYF